ncbi:MAG: hypothetical protein RL141_1023 [Candidatus Parcubacteria bacterium]|jgi:UDP-N-acetyl-D-mannosaminuronic acid dehydrogenase
MNDRTSFPFDVGVIGLGRVGLPLALSFVETGARVIGFEKSDKELAAIRDGRMPFQEPGYTELAASKKLETTTEHRRVSEVEHLIITVGTPLRQHVETDLSQVMQVMENLLPHLREGQTLILRSTVAPQTTRYVERVLRTRTSFEIGKNFFLAFCPERLAAGKAKQEIATLPQIVGAEDPESARRASALFTRLGPKTLETDFTSAELAKLFSNIYRYVNFAMANHFAYVADRHNANIYEIVRLANQDYPRNNIASPGFAAGACLRKDFGMISEDSPYGDLFLAAWRVNEHTPRFLVNGLKKRTDLFNKRIVVLGASFKRDSDDLRDSLTPKLVRTISREVPKSIAVHDPHAAEIIEEMREDFSVPNAVLSDVLPTADVVFIAVNHRAYEQNFRKIYDTVPVGTWFVDIWNVSRRDRTFFKK